MNLNLLTLPLELRTKIYESIFHSPTSFISLHHRPASSVKASKNQIRSRTSVFQWKHPDGTLLRTHTSILLTCKQFYHEAHRLLYTSNTIYVRLSPHVADLLTYREAQKEIRYCFLGSDFSTIGSELRLATALNEALDWCAKDDCPHLGDVFLTSTKLKLVYQGGYSQYTSERSHRLLSWRFCRNYVSVMWFNLRYHLARSRLGQTWVNNR